MPILEKIKSKGGKSTLRSKKIGGKPALISTDVEYKTKTSPRTVYKNIEIMDDEGTTSYRQKKVAGKIVDRDTSFIPKPKIQLGPIMSEMQKQILKKGGSVKSKKK